jgi:hypothetical protein
MTAKLTKEMHFTMGAADHAGLKAMADKECRTLNAQLLYILRQALAEHRKRVAPFDVPDEAERITNGTRARLKSLA